MKIFVFIIVFFFNSFTTFAQSEFKKSLVEISSDLCIKLLKKGKSKVVILYVTDASKSNTVAGKYLADKISVNIVNDTANFQVFDRENLNEIAEAKKMIADGYIDVGKVKELGKLLSVDAIIIGNYTVLSKTIDLTLKALDSSTGFNIAASSQELPLDGDACVLLGINVSTEGNGAKLNDENRGFNNQPLNSNERYNNPETVAKDCKEKNTGDYCFYNSTKETLYIDMADLILLKPDETQCFYGIQSKSYDYYIGSPNKDFGNGKFFNRISAFIYGKGQISVETCKSKTFTIK